MAHVRGVGPEKEPLKPVEPETEPKPLKPGKDDRVPNKWSEAVKKFPQLLDAVCKGLALKIMRESKKKAQKRMREK